MSIYDSRASNAAVKLALDGHIDCPSVTDQEATCLGYDAMFRDAATVLEGFIKAHPLRNDAARIKRWLRRERAHIET